MDRTVKEGIIIKAASWYKYNNKVLAQGKIKTINYLKENIGLYKKLKQEVRHIENN